MVPAGACGPCAPRRSSRLPHTHPPPPLPLRHTAEPPRSLGLIPIRADPREFDWPSEAAGATDLNTLVFGLDVTGVEAPPSKRDGGAGDRLTHVYSRDITWGPQGGQEERFADRPVEPVEGDIVLAKLLPGQTICLEAHAVKGTGADHAKFSPVATASYRLAPEVELPGEGFVGDDARSLVATCPMGVFDIEDVGSSTGPRAVVAQPRACTMCRECLRPAGWAQRVRLRKVNDHFLFRVESTGALPAATLVEMALEVRPRDSLWPARARQRRPRRRPRQPARTQHVAPASLQRLALRCFGPSILPPRAPCPPCPVLPRLAVRRSSLRRPGTPRRRSRQPLQPHRACRQELRLQPGASAPQRPRLAASLPWALAMTPTLTTTEAPSRRAQAPMMPTPPPLAPRRRHPPPPAPRSSPRSARVAGGRVRPTPTSERPRPPLGATLRTGDRGGLPAARFGAASRPHPTGSRSSAVCCALEWAAAARGERLVGRRPRAPLDEVLLLPCAARLRVFSVSFRCHVRPAVLAIVRGSGWRLAPQARRRAPTRHRRVAHAHTASA